MSQTRAFAGPRRGLWRDDSGSVSIMAGAFLTVALGAAALAVDLGSLYLERRSAQAAADLAAMAAANDLDHAEQAAEATVTANGVARVKQFKVSKGSYEANPDHPADKRFTAGRQPFNAVRVALTSEGQLYFARTFLGGSKMIAVEATAASAAQATFSIGSRLASVRDGLPNAVLGALLGGNVNLSAMDYNALIDANLTIQSVLDGLASALHITGGTYGEVLSANATMSDVLAATASAAQASGDAAAAAALNKLQSSASAKTISLESLIDLGALANVSVGEPHAGLGGKVSAMALVSTAASLANGSNQVNLNLGAGVPGLLSLKLDLAVGEAKQHSAWVSVGQEGSEIHTAQLRFRLLAEIGGLGALAGVHIWLPAYFELAGAHATLSRVACSPGGSGGTATIAARPSVARAWIGEVDVDDLDDFSSDPAIAPANIVRTPVISIRGSAHVAMTNARDEDLDFDQGDVDDHAIKTVETTDFVKSVVTSLVGDLNLSVQVAGLGIGLPGASQLKSAALNSINPVAATLDAVVETVLKTLGVHLGEADIQVHGIRCGNSVLAG